MEHWLKPRPRKPQQITNKALQQSYTRTNKHNFGAETHIILQYESVHKTHHFAIYNLYTHTTSPIQPWGGWAGLSLLTHMHVIDFNLISHKNKTKINKQIISAYPFISIFQVSNPIELPCPSVKKCLSYTSVIITKTWRQWDRPWIYESHTQHTSQPLIQ